MSNLPYQPANEQTLRSFNRPLHLATLATALLAFPLVWMGGLVTSHGAGMSVPDWPNSYGYNMFALPFSQWIGSDAGGTFYEHFHRLLGTLVGLSAFVATMLAWAPSASQKWRKAWGWTAATAAVLFLASLTAAWTLRYTGAASEERYKSFTHLFSGFASLAIASGVCWACRRREPSRGRRWLVTSVLLIVIVQGLMGGFRVDRISLVLAKLHGIFGQVTFAFAGVVATACSAWWLAVGARPAPEGRRIRRHVVIAIVLISVQLALGALMRHDPSREANASRGDGSAGLAIPDWPLHYGKLLPPVSAAGLDRVNDFRVWELHWPAVSQWQIWLHFSHRLGAYLTTLAVFAVVWIAWRRHSRDAKVLWPATILGGLVVAQVTLGVFTVLTRKAADVATLHQATGALLLMTASVLAARAFRLYSIPSTVPAVLPATDRRDAPATLALAGVGSDGRAETTLRS